MTRRFRLVAGPNGSGKSTLKRQLERDYAVNFYDYLNADDIFAEAKRTQRYMPRIEIAVEALQAYAAQSSYADAVRRCFTDGSIALCGECVRFATPEAVNSYTIALLTNFLRDEHIRQQTSLSQETVFSHSSKVDALARARAAGFRTYLYFVATETPLINVARVSARVGCGGHDVPTDKIAARYGRSLANIRAALPHLSRAYFFDNSTDAMTCLAQWDDRDGVRLHTEQANLPKWFVGLSLA